MRFLIVEDDPKTASFIRNGFVQNGFSVDVAVSGEDAWELSRTIEYDLAVIDLMLPGLDGLTLVERLRNTKYVAPVIVLSAKCRVEDRVRCLEHGADDFVPKPFAFSELLARSQAVLRRARGSNEPRLLEAGGLKLDIVSREVTLAGEPIELQPREFKLLECLMRNPGKALSKTYFLERLWDYSFDPQTNVVDVLVCRLRKKIEKEGIPKLIHTMRGVGYVFRSQ